MNKHLKNYDIIFLITGKPLPAMLDMAFYAQNEGKKTLMLILERGNEDLIIDRNLVNFEIQTINVPYKGVDMRRIISVPQVFISLSSTVRNKLKDDGVLVASSYDLLLFGWIISLYKRISLRYQVRDLHALQLSNGFLSSTIVYLEKMMLKRVDRIIVSSSEFFNRYFKNIYTGKSVLLENVPARETWYGFKKEAKGEFFTIGFIGIIRYEKSLRQLVNVVERIAESGYKIRVKFAGGGNLDGLKSMINEPSLFNLSGPYEYTKDIKKLYADIDLIYAVYDSEDLNCQIAMPNKFYESIITKIPIIVAKGTFVGTEVERTGIGTSVYTEDHGTLEILLRAAIKDESWYKNAKEALMKIDANTYYDSYEVAMKESISH